MKRILSITAVLSLMLALSACGPSMGGQIEGESYKTEGWMSEDIFRVTATGVPKEGLINEVQKKGTAKEAALIMAQKRIIEKFVGARLEGAAGSADYASTGIAVSKEFSGVVKGGTIVKTTYDEDSNAEIIYQIESKGLKKRVMGTATQ